MGLGDEFMKMKKFLLGFLIAFGFFFLGSVSVEAYTLTICEYSMPENSIGYWGPPIPGHRVLNWTPKFKVVWAGNTFVTASLSSNVTQDGLKQPEEGDTILPSDAMSIMENHLKIEKSKLTEVCPAQYTTKALWEGYQRVGYEAGTYTYERTNIITYDSANLPPLSCTYGGNRSKGTPAPYYLDKDQRLNINNANRFPGKSENGSYHFNDITVNIKLGQTTDVYGGYSVTSNDLKEGTQSKFKGTIFNSQIKEVGIASAYHIEQVVSWLEKRECPEWLLYHPDHGLYLSTDTDISGEDAADLEGVSVNLGLFGWLRFNGDKDYAIYQVSYTKQCNEILSNVNNALTKAEERANGLISELKSYQDGSLTMEKYNQLKKETDELQQTVIDAYTKNNWAEFFDGSDLKCKIEDGKNITERRDKFLNLLTGSDENSVNELMNRAIANSKNISQTDKSSLLPEWNGLMNSIDNKFEEFIFSVSEKPMNCETLFGDFNDPTTFGGFLQKLFNYVKLIAPLLVIIFGSLDFGKAVLSSDQDALKKAQGNFIKRCIAAVILFFLPTLIMLILDLLNKYISGSIDPNCLIK